MPGWRWRPLVMFGAPPLHPQPAATPAVDSPNPDTHATVAKPRNFTAADSPQAGQFERRVPIPAPSRIDPHCQGCAGRDQVIRQREDELRLLRRRLAAYELPATRNQRLAPVTEQLP